MKKKSLLFLLPALGMILTGCGDNNQPSGDNESHEEGGGGEQQEEAKVESISLGSLYVDLFVGETHTIVATILPEAVKDKSVSFAISDKDGNEATTDVISVTNAGVVEALKAGQAWVKVTSNADTTKFKVAQFTVYDVPATMPKSTSDGFQLKTNAQFGDRDVVYFGSAIGDTYYMMPKYTSGNNIGAIEVTSTGEGEEEVLNVTAEAAYAYKVIKNSDGTVSFQFDGNKYLSVRTNENGLVSSDEINDKSKFNISFVEGVLSMESVAENGGKNHLWLNSTNKIFGCYLADKNYSPVCMYAAEEEYVTGISVTTPPTKTEYYKGTSLDTTGMVVSGTTNKGNTVEITGYTVTPQTFEEVGDSVVVTITYQGLEATTTVKVSEPPAQVKLDGVSIGAETLNLFEDETSYTFTPVLDPVVATIDEASISWTSSNPAAATVENGVLTVVAAGTTTVTYSVTDTLGNTKTATCVVTIEEVKYGTAEAPLSVAYADRLMKHALKNAGDEIETQLVIKGVVSDRGTDKSTYLQNVHVKENDADILIYSLNPGDTDATALANVVVGSEVTFKGYAKNYRGTLEIADRTIDDVKVYPSILAINNPATGVSVSPTTASMGLNETLSLTATVNPEIATNKTVTWSSSDETVATVADGVVTSVGAGTATITVRTNDGNFEATCVVTVVARTLESIEVTTLPKTDYCAGEAFDLSGMVLTLHYNTGDETITEGYSVSLEEGTVINEAKEVTVTYANKTASFNVTVSQTKDLLTLSSLPVGTSYGTFTKTMPGTGIKYNGYATTLNDATNGKAIQMKKGEIALYTVNSDRVIKSITFDINGRQGDDAAVGVYGLNGSFNTAGNLSQFDDNQLLGAVKKGDTVKTITLPEESTIRNFVLGAKGEYACYVNSILVEYKDEKVTQVIDSIALNKEEATMYVGDTLTLEAAVEGLGDLSVDWTSSDAETASVENGVVTALKASAEPVVITATSKKDSTKSASCTITVNEPRSFTSLSVTGGFMIGYTASDTDFAIDDLKVFANYTSGDPEEVTDYTVTWSDAFDNTVGVHSSTPTIHWDGHDLTLDAVTYTVETPSALPTYVELSTTGGTNASAATVKIGNEEKSAIKAGTGKASGAVKVKLPSGTKSVVFKAAAWNGESVKLTITAGDKQYGPIALTADSGVANSSPFTLSTTDMTNFAKSFDLDEALTAETEFTFTATTGKRFVIWDVGYIK